MYTLVVADSNFKVMGEGVMPPGLRIWGDFAPMFFPDGTVAFQNPEKSEAYVNKYVFEVFKIEYKNDPGGKKLKKAAADYRKSMAGEAYTDLAKYLTKRHGAPAAGKRAFLLAPADNSCPSCLESVCRLYRDSISVFQSKNIGFVMTAGSTATITKATEENAMPPGYLTDPKNDVLRYVPPWINPRWVVMENGNIVKDEIHHPAEIPNLRKKLRNFRPCGRTTTTFRSLSHEMSFCRKGKTIQNETPSMFGTAPRI